MNGVGHEGDADETLFPVRFITGVCDCDASDRRTDNISYIDVSFNGKVIDYFRST
jgi:hypothetical protein